MDFKFTPIKPADVTKVLSLFKAAAEKIAKKNIDHWQYWKNPPIEKVKWVEEGIQNNEFFFIENADGVVMGMVRILETDVLYWGEQPDKARYVHSLVVSEAYAGKGLGEKILQSIEDTARSTNCAYLRLDCDSANPKLCEYYERQGFVKVGQKELPLSIYNLYQKEIIS